MSTTGHRRRRASLCAGLALAIPFGDTAAAQTRLVRIDSKILGEERIVHVHVPPDYDLARQRYEVTYLLDGHIREFFDLTVAAAAYDVVADVHDYAAPPQIVVGVDQRDRGVDLGRNQEQFTRFLVEELVPFIDREYRTNHFRTLIGHSLGGRFALMTFCRAPGVFPAVIAISAAAGDSSSGGVSRCLATAFASDRTTVRQLVLSAGEQETRLLPGLRALDAFVRANAPPNWRLLVVEHAGPGHVDTPLHTIPYGIRFVHDKSVWEMPPALADSMIAGEGDPDRLLTDFYAGLSRRVGVSVSPSLKWMLAAAHTRVRGSDTEAALDAVRRLISAYPEELEGYGLLADVELRRNDPSAARQALRDGLRILGKADIHDAYERERKLALLTRALASLDR